MVKNAWDNLQQPRISFDGRQIQISLSEPTGGGWEIQGNGSPTDGGWIHNPPRFYMIKNIKCCFILGIMGINESISSNSKPSTGRRLRIPIASWNPIPMIILWWWTCCGLTLRASWWRKEGFCLRKRRMWWCGYDPDVYIYIYIYLYMFSTLCNYVDIISMHLKFSMHGLFMCTVHGPRCADSAFLIPWKI